MKYKKGDTYKVIWRDIHGITNSSDVTEWYSEEHLIEKAKKAYQEQMVTVGILVAETDKWVCIASTSDGREESSYCDASMIPKTNIIKITKLK